MKFYEKSPTSNTKKIILRSNCFHNSSNIIFNNILIQIRSFFINNGLVQMKILLDIQKLKSKFANNGPLRIKIKIGNTFSLWTELLHPSQGVYAFMERYQINLHKRITEYYVQLMVIAEDGSILAQITVFFDKFKQLNKIDIKSGQSKYQLHYSLKQIADSKQSELKNQRLNTSYIDQQPELIRQQKGKLQILRLGILMYNFSQRLDPLIALFNHIMSILTWKNPLKTTLFGILLTLVLLYTKTSILIGCIAMFFSKDYVFKKLSQLNKYHNIHKRLLVPQQNAYFLQKNMDKYCQIYQNICTFLFSDDKTMLVNIINIFCRSALLGIFLMILFSAQTLIILSLWVVLLATSPFCQNLSFLRPTLRLLFGQYERIFKKMSSQLQRILGNSNSIEQLELSKQFYFYHYERWWVVKGWCDQSKKYSDEKEQTSIQPREKAPQGWAWIQEWKLDFQSNQFDASGYQYANDVMKEFKSTCTLPTRRRRKWRRKCAKIALEP